MIAFNNLEILDNSGIQRFGCLPEFIFYQKRNVCHCTFSVDQGPDKASLSIQMDLGKSAVC